MYCNKCGDPIEPNEKFCNKCGNPLSVQQNVQQNQNTTLPNQNTYNETSNKKMIFIGMGIGVGAIFILLLIAQITNVFREKYYFDTNPERQDDETLQPLNNSNKKKKYQTAIIYDNVYSGVQINQKTDALDLIIKDSTSQKNKCPNDIKKIEEELINSYGITAVNLCEMDVDFAKELGNVFKKIYEEYPSVRGYITNMTLVNASLSINYIAAFMPFFQFATSDAPSTYPWVFKTQVLLNSSYFLNKDRLQRSVTEGSSSGHFPKNATIYSPVAHELGHYLSFLAMMKHYNIDSIILVDNSNIDSILSLAEDFSKGDYSLSMINQAYENYKRDTNTTMNLDEWRGTISKYALAKDNNGAYIYDETIAESFHDVYLNGDNASDASKYVVAVLKERLES